MVGGWGVNGLVGVCCGVGAREGDWRGMRGRVRLVGGMGGMMVCSKIGCLADISCDDESVARP